MNMAHQDERTQMENSSRTALFILFFVVVFAEEMVGLHARSRLLDAFFPDSIVSYLVFVLYVLAMDVLFAGIWTGIISFISRHVRFGTIVRRIGVFLWFFVHIK